MTTSNGPQSVFSVGFTRVSEAGISLDQHAVMAGSVTSGAYWYTFAEPVAALEGQPAARHPAWGHRLAHRPGLLTGRSGPHRPRRPLHPG